MNERPLRVVRSPGAIPNSHDILCCPPPNPVPSTEYPIPMWFSKEGPVEASVLVNVACLRGEEAIDHLIASWDLEGPAHEVIFIDDGMNCGRDILQSWSAIHRRVSAGKIIVNTQTQGYPMACNDAVNTAAGRIIVFLDADSRLERGWLAPLLAAFEDPAVGIAGSLRVREGGIFHGTIESAGCEWKWSDLRFSDLGRETANLRDLPSPLRPDQAGDLLTPGERDALIGGCVAVRSDLFRYLGGYDPNYRVGTWADADLNMRVKEHGSRAVFVPSSKIVRTGRTDAVVGTDRDFFINKWCNSGRIDRMVKAIRTTPMPPVHHILLRRSGKASDVRLAASVATGLKSMHPGCMISFATDCPEALRDCPDIDLIVKDHESSERLAYVYYNLDLCPERRPGCERKKAFEEYVGICPT